MRLTPLPRDPAEYDGFKNGDLFGYKAFGDRLTTIVTSVDHSTVIMLDGAWGSGKSTFIHQWKAVLSANGHQVIVFDAFKNDHQDEPFFALATEIYEHIRKNSPRHAGTFRNRAAAVGWFAWSLGTRFAVKFATMRHLSYGDLKAADQYRKKKRPSKLDAENLNLENIIIEGLEERIDQSISKQNSVRNLQQILEESIRHIRQNIRLKRNTTDSSVKGSQKLVLIVDELDRCMPIFALRLLESVKHVFSIKEMCFVIVTHVQRLEETVESVYGITDGGSYLEKFYDVRVKLPLTGEKPSHEKRKTYLTYLLETMDIAAYGESLHTNISSTLLPICHMHNVELRSLEKIVTNVALFILCGTNTSSTTIPVISAVSAMRVLDVELYRKVRDREVEYQDIERFMRFTDWPMGWNRKYGRLVEYWRSLLGKIETEEDERRFSLMFPFGLHPDERLRFLSDIVDHIDTLR